MKRPGSAHPQLERIHRIFTSRHMTPAKFSEAREASGVDPRWEAGAEDEDFDHLDQAPTADSLPIHIKKEDT